MWQPFPPPGADRASCSATSAHQRIFRWEHAAFGIVRPARRPPFPPKATLADTCSSPSSHRVLLGRRAGVPPVRKRAVPYRGLDFAASGEEVAQPARSRRRIGECASEDAGREVSNLRTSLHRLHTSDAWHGIAAATNEQRSRAPSGLGSSSLETPIPPEASPSMSPSTCHLTLAAQRTTPSSCRRTAHYRSARSEPSATLSLWASAQLFGHIPHVNELAWDGLLALFACCSRPASTAINSLAKGCCYPRGRYLHT